MKKLLLLFITVIYLSGCLYGACNCPNHSGRPHSHNNSSHSSSSGESVRLINTEYQKSEHKFPNCNEHYVITETTVNHYSDGSKRVFANSTIYNKDGSVIESDCKSVEHLIFEGKHYFIIQKNGYKIIDHQGNIITKRTYSKMTKIRPDRILVRRDKRYGIIDLNEKNVVPLRYQNMTLVGDDIFITKLNKYYGLIDADNNVIIKNNCEKIKPFRDVILLKRYGKYGLADVQGNIIQEMIYDKIKKYKEYILIKKDGKYGVLDFEGKVLSPVKYDKIRLERNTLQGLYKNNWLNISDE